MFTRQEYLAGVYGTDTERAAAHRRYFGQFVTEDVKDIVGRRIGERLLLASTDPHFNDIPLAAWDEATMFLTRETRDAFRRAGDVYSLGGGVCLLKEAARQIVAQHTESEG